MAWEKFLVGSDVVKVRKNSGAVIGTRLQLNLIEGTNVSLSVQDDSGDGEVDVTVNSATELSGDLTPEFGGEVNAGAHSIGFTLQTKTGTGSTTIDWKLGNKCHFTWGAQAETFTFTAPSYVGNLLILMTQDGDGGRDATLPATLKWLGTEPTWTDGGAGKSIMVAIFWEGANYWAMGSSWEA